MKLEEIKITEIYVLIDRRQTYNLNCKSLLKIANVRLFNNKKSQLITKIANKKKTNLILSLDIKDVNLFLGFIKYIGPYICGIKTHLDILDEINCNIFYSNIEKIKETYNIIWIEDRKFADIGSIMIKQYLTYKIEPDFITVHGISGKESIIELNNNINAGILLIYEMSSKGNLFNTEYKSLILEIGKDINAAGFICQNTDNISSNFLTFTPGINLEQYECDKSQMYSDPRTKKSDFYIVGRGILNNNILYNSVLYRNLCYFKKTNETIFLNRKLISNIYNAAGVHCTSYNELLDLDYSGSGIVLSKTCTKEARIGNDFPRYYINEDLSINSTGLANDGIDVYKQYKFNKPYIISLAATNIEDFKYSLDQISPENIFAIEVNISCPNIENFSENALNNFEEYLIMLNKYSLVPWGLKMPIFLSNNELEKYVNIIKNYNISFIVCANSLPNGLVLNNQIPVIKPRNGLGGIGGFAGFKALALNNAREFKKLLPKIDIIGCGGIKTKEDKIELKVLQQHPIVLFLKYSFSSLLL
jgi:orotidine 5'-phosphate decarboxylase subfamily 1